MSEPKPVEGKPARPAIKPEDRVPTRQKIAYSMGVVSDHYANICLSTFLSAFFVDFMKIGAAIPGYAMGAARLWDAFTDPLVGTLSDRSKSKYGRRKPLIFVGAVLTGLCFPLIWLVPETWSPTAITIYLFAVLLVFYSCYSIFSVPYEALGAELTPDYQERSRVFAVRSIIQQFFALGIIWAFPFAMFLATLTWVNGEIGGVRIVAWAIGLVVLLAGILPALGCVERYRTIAQSQGKENFWQGVRALLRNKPYLIIIGTICTFLFSIIATMNLAYFVNVYYVYGGEIQKGAVLGGIDGTLRFFFSVAAAYAIKRFSDRFDKHHMMITCTAILLVAFIGIYFTTLPGRPWLTLSMKPLLAIGEVGFWVLVLSMRADVCDWDEYLTGKRNEGLIAATMNWVNKIAITGAVIISGVLLQHVVGFDSKLSDELRAEIAVEAQTDFTALPEAAKTGDDAVTLESLTKSMEQKAIMAKQSPGTMERLRLTYTLPPIIALAICLVLLWRYPLSQEKLSQVRAELEERRGKASG